MTNSWDRPAEILLVEDNQYDAEFLRIALQSVELPHNLHVAIDGQQAMDFLQQSKGYEGSPRPDLILLDINMPGMDGREFLSTVKNDVNFVTIPVVMLTTTDSPTDIYYCYANHANAYVTKPLDPQGWRQMVHDLVHFWLGVAKLSTQG